MKYPFFSVIIPIFNVKDYLGNCIDSVLGQSFKDYELVLVDDGSTDGCGLICDEYSLIDSRIRVLHQKNQGLVGARQAGINAAEGKYSIYIDGDDWIDENELLGIYNTLTEHPVDMVEFGFIKEYDESFTMRHGLLPEGEVHQSELWDWINESIKRDVCFVRPIEATLCCKAIRTEILREIQNEIDKGISWGEGIVTTYALLNEVNSVYIMRSFLYHYRVNANSMLHSGKSGNYEEIKRQLYRTWDKHKKSVSKQYLKYILLYLFVLCCPTEAIEAIAVPCLQQNCKTVVYGKGVFAKSFTEIAPEYGVNIVGNIDSFDLNSISQMEYDQIFIAILIGQDVENCIEKLIDTGVPTEKIKYIKWSVINKL